MQKSQFNIWNKVCAAVAFLVSAVTYLLTIEPSASFWDCGEFIASSYKLEVGHPPGNPVFQLIARFFTLFGDAGHAAILVNAMSAICSALTIFLLYLTIVWLAKRLVKEGPDGGYSLHDAVAVMGSGLIGSLIYCFSDTFWFSAVEGEVYAMSSLVTALVFWAMTRWYDCAEEPHANRWIVLIAFLMGLSIGIHLLNLLAIPALVFMYYFRMKPEYTFRQNLGIFMIGVVILAVILYAVIPILPKAAAYFDLFFVNVLHLPFNSGAIVFLVLLLALCFRWLFKSLEKEKVFLNTVLLCFTTILIGFSIFSIDIIRSCAKTPTNEYQPDNAFTLVRYLSREQYGKAPLIYGQYFDSPYDLTSKEYWAPINDRYRKVDGPVDAKYRSEGKMLFPRMWSSSSDEARQFYLTYTGNKGRKVKDAKYRKPTMGANLTFFFDYQMGWMYWRYFMWNFVGRQNEIHGSSQNYIHGNWESGIGFLDAIRLGDQSDAPAILAGNKGKNHYFFLPLILGLIGLCFQFGKDKRGLWLVFLMFFMTGAAIVIYLNQPPYQVRERDYAYAGSFYFFSIWCGLALAAVADWLKGAFGGRCKGAVAIAATAALLFVPVLMAAQNWDDHDRSNRRTAVEMASNYLNSVGENGILITHGDNDTFPLWYAQEVEGVRPDVRICNTSLLGTDWHIDQMKYAVNESAPLKLGVGLEQYLYGTNEYVPIYDTRNEVMDIADVMTLFKHPKVKVSLSSGRKVDYIASRRISVPVNRENVIKYGILDKKYADRIPDSIILTIPEGKEFISKPELFMLDLLSNYDWSRPLHMLNMGGDLNMGIKEYLENVGYSYLFIPVKNRPSGLNIGFCDTDELYRKMTQVYKWDALAADNYFIDYQNMYTHMGVMSVRQLFVTAANAFMKEGRKDRALEMMDKCYEVMRNYPLETIPIGFSSNDYIVVEMVQAFFKLGCPEKALEISEAFSDSLLEALPFLLRYDSDDAKSCASYVLYIEDELKENGHDEMAASIDRRLREIVSI